MNRVLILNTGSSSLKWAVLDADTEATIGEGNASWEGDDPDRHADEIAAALRGVPPFGAVGHRVVHGGASFTEAVVMDDRVRAEIAALAALAPLHNPAALAGIAAVTKAFPDAPQVAAFDTAFHATLPDAARTYALPREWIEEWGLRRYGFHGLSVAYATRRANEMLGILVEEMHDVTTGRTVVCHLGSGCSITAVAAAGKSVDTTMGFTPLDGLVMATRSGAVDPGLLLYLLREGKLSADELAEGLNEHGGFAALSGLGTGGKDFREVVKAMDAGDVRARLAYDVFVHSIVRGVGAMIAVLGGLDALVFTGGIGEHQPRVRRDVAAAFAFAGVRLDAARNDAAQGDTDISDAGATAATLVITAREDLTVLREVKRLLGG